MFVFNLASDFVTAAWAEQLNGHFTRICSALVLVFLLSIAQGVSIQKALRLEWKVSFAADRMSVPKNSLLERAIC